MANMDNDISEKVLQNAYAGSGHPVKDKLLKFLEEVQSEINVLNGNVGAIAGSSDITTLNSDVAILKTAVGLASDTTVDVSNAVAIVGGLQGSDPTASTFTSAYSTTTADISNLVTQISNVIAVQAAKVGDPAASTLAGGYSTLVSAASNLIAANSNIVGTQAARLGDPAASTLVSAYSTTVASASNLVAILSNTVGYAGGTLVTDPSASTITAYLSTLFAEVKAISDVSQAGLTSDITAVASDLDLVEKSLSDIVAEAGPKLQADPAASTFADFVSTLVAEQSNLYAINSNIVATQAAAVVDPAASTLVSAYSQAVATLSNTVASLSNAVGYQGAKLVDPAASTFLSSYSTAVAAVSNTTAEISNAVGLMGGKFVTDPAASTLKSYLSTMAADQSNLYFDVTNNVKSNILSHGSNLRALASNWVVKYTSDIAVQSNIHSEVATMISDLATMISNMAITA